MMQEETETIVKVFRKVALCPSVQGATLLKNGDKEYTLESSWQQRDLERADNVKYVKWSTFENADSKIEVGTGVPASETNGELLSRFSPSGKRKAVIREVTDKKKKKIQYLEIWDATKKIVNINLKESDKHGDVHSNPQFGSLQWSEDEGKVLYIAEAKIPKTESFFKARNVACDEGGDAKKEECLPGDEHAHKESWGELLTECYRPTVCVLDIASQEITAFSDVIPGNISAGQAVWGHDGRVLFVGWDNEPFRLGLRMCMIRKNDLYMLDVIGKTCTRLTKGEDSIFCPRLHPTRNAVYFLANPIGGAHLNCNRLMCLELPTGEAGAAIAGSKTVLDVVKSAKTSEDFPGLFVMDLANNCWSAGRRYMFMTSSWRSNRALIAINVENGSVKRLSQDGDVTVLDVKDDIVAVSHSTPSSPPKIKVGIFRDGSIGEWIDVERPHEDFADIEWSIHQFVPELKNPEYPDVNCDFIMIQPADGAVQRRGLIINPHGGPHSHSNITFVPGTTGLCLLGYTVVQVNYRGSTGYGRDGIHSLSARVGTQDVSDVHQAAKLVKEKYGFEKVFVAGGSHGGFLSLHLIGQYPAFYSATCVRNPVTNLVSMLGVSDIPDWVYYEVGIPGYAPTMIPTAERYAKMLAMSPIACIETAKTPCAVMIGDKDLRVPPSQGKEWARKYKALGRKCKVFEYKGNSHPLHKVDAEADGFVNMVLWFNEN